ncbi:hypothetical protein AB0J42_37355, partial [Nonomuraea sp. NPDC049649]
QPSAASTRPAPGSAITGDVEIHYLKICECSTGQLIPALVKLYEQGRFPFDRLVRYYELGEIEQALADSASGAVIKPILRMPH